MLNVLAVAAGGAIGAGARYALTAWARRALEGGAPAGTLIVNVLGCLLLGLIVPWLLADGRDESRPEIRAFLVFGVLGGFTTFSTYAYEAFAFLSDGQWQRAAFVFLLNNALGLACVLGGYRLGLWLQRTV